MDRVGADCSGRKGSMHPSRARRFHLSGRGASRVTEAPALIVHRRERRFRGLFGGKTEAGQRGRRWDDRREAPVMRGVMLGARQQTDEGVGLGAARQHRESQQPCASSRVAARGGWTKAWGAWRHALQYGSRIRKFHCPGYTPTPVNGMMRRFSARGGPCLVARFPFCRAKRP